MWSPACPCGRLVSMPRTEPSTSPRPDDIPPQAWDARVEMAHLALIRVLLRVHERLIAEGKLKQP